MKVYIVCAVQTGDPGFLVRAYSRRVEAEEVAATLNKGGDVWGYVVEELEFV